MVTRDYPQLKTAQTYTPEQFYDVSRMFDPLYEYELHQGNIIQMTPSSMLPSKIALRISLYIGMYLLENDIGHLTGADGAYILSEEYTYAPDVGYISYERQAEDIPEGFVPHAPDFAVEVLSPTDNKRAVQDKARTYLKFGTQLVWIVDPAAQQVEVYHPEQDVVTRETGDQLSGYDVLPNFTLALDTIFFKTS